VRVLAETGASAACRPEAVQPRSSATERPAGSRSVVQREVQPRPQAVPQRVGSQPAEPSRPAAAVRNPCSRPAPRGWGQDSEPQRTSGRTTRLQSPCCPTRRQGTTPLGWPHDGTRSRSRCDRTRREHHDCRVGVAAIGRAQSRDAEHRIAVQRTTVTRRPALPQRRLLRRRPHEDLRLKGIRPSVPPAPPRAGGTVASPQCPARRTPPPVWLSGGARIFSLNRSAPARSVLRDPSIFLRFTRGPARPDDTRPKETPKQIAPPQLGASPRFDQGAKRTAGAAGTLSALPAAMVPSRRAREIAYASPGRSDIPVISAWTRATWLSHDAARDVTPRGNAVHSAAMRRERDRDTIMESGGEP
jgi:hypothetical protein